jgi:hypothetical protein
MRKGTMNTFPKFRFVSSDIHVSYYGMSRTKDIIAARPQTCRHDNFFSHENPWQKRIKGNISQEIRMGHKVPRRGKGSKPWNIQMNVIIILFRTIGTKQTVNRFGTIIIGPNPTGPIPNKQHKQHRKTPKGKKDDQSHNTRRHAHLCHFLLRGANPWAHSLRSKIRRHRHKRPDTTGTKPGTTGTYTSSF